MHGCGQREPDGVSPPDPGCVLHKILCGRQGVFLGQVTVMDRLMMVAMGAPLPSQDGGGSKAELAPLAADASPLELEMVEPHPTRGSVLL